MKVLNAIAIILVCIGMLGVNMKAQASENVLTAKEKSMISISALTAKGNLRDLEKALEQGLKNGLTVNEIKELLVQVYAYAGFPRSLNGLAAFSAVLEKRKAQGINDVIGKTASPVPANQTSLEFGTANQTKLFGREVKGGLYDFAPQIDQYLKAHLFGDIFQRDVLTWKDRELITVAILAGIDDVDPQLQAHLATCVKVGWTHEQLFEYADVIGGCLGKKYGSNAKKQVRIVLKQAAVSREEEMNNLDIPFGLGEFNKAYAQYFKGNSYLNRLSTDQVSVANVTFEPACRNNWHIHHAEQGGGQILLCTFGEGWYQEWGKEARSLKAGDVVNIPAGVKHWHGAKKDSWFTHIAIEVPAKNGSNEWLEPISDEDYLNLHK